MSEEKTPYEKQYEKAEAEIEEAKRTDATELDLSGLRLQSIPPEIKELQNLTSLNLEKNQLVKLPAELFHLTGLTKLNLTSNPLTTLPPEIGQLESLTYLELRHCGLVALPPEIGQLINLTILNLNSNHLTTLPREFWQLLPNFTSLGLQHNRLIDLPPDIANGGLEAIRSYRRNKEEQAEKSLPKFTIGEDFNERFSRLDELEVMFDEVQKTTRLVEKIKYLLVQHMNDFSESQQMKIWDLFTKDPITFIFNLGRLALQEPAIKRSLETGNIIQAPPPALKSGDPEGQVQY